MVNTFCSIIAMAPLPCRDHPSLIILKASSRDRKDAKKYCKINKWIKTLQHNKNTKVMFRA